MIRSCAMTPMCASRIVEKETTVLFYLCVWSQFICAMIQFIWAMIHLCVLRLWLHFKQRAKGELLFHIWMKNSYVLWFIYAYMHLCIMQRGASIKWEGEDVKMYHHCYDPERSGLAGQKPRQVKGLGLHVCKKCHRTATKCKQSSCLAPACSNNSLRLCKHLH